MSAAEVIAEIKALPDNERDRVLSYLVADTELREDLQDSITIEARRHEPSRPLADVLHDLGIKTRACALESDVPPKKSWAAFPPRPGNASRLHCWVLLNSRSRQA